MTRQTFHPPTGGVGWLDPETGQGYTPTTGRISFTPGTDPSTIIAAISGAIPRQPGSPAAASSPSTSTGGNAAAQSAATASFTNQLRQDGLGDLEPFVDDWVVQGLTWEQILARLDDLKTNEGQVVDRLYPERRLRREAGLSAMSIGEIRQWRDSARATLRTAGLPSTFYDEPSDFTPWIVADVDPAEFQERVGLVVDWAQTAPKETRDQLRDLYGVDEAGLAAYVLDPQKAIPALRRQRAAAGIAGISQRVGFGALTASEAERLVSLGVDDAAASQGFQTLAGLGEVRSAIVGERGGVNFDRGQQLGAVFEGDVETREQIEKQGANRVAPFAARGGVASNREGYAGLGSTSR